MDALYVHIPFCLKKCLYCDFNSYVDNSREREYIKALIKEIKSLGQHNYKTIFIGGGTPTTLSYKSLEMLLEALAGFHAEEFTIESNPGTLDREKLRILKNNGVNRLSIGLQAWQDSLLKTLGRIHSLNEFLEAYYMAREEGFSNINVDLMFAIPGQTSSHWNETLDKVIQLNPSHISCYSLIVEEGTPFYIMKHKGLLKLPDEDTERNMYWHAVDMLRRAGYSHYEISNFSKQGLECRHNVVYWKDKEYVGAGAGAYSYNKGFRYYNYKGIDEYIHAVDKGCAIVEKTAVTKKNEMEEFMFLGMRMIKGVSKSEFKERFLISMDEVYGSQLKKFTSLKLIYDDGEMVMLTKRGIDISNQIFEEFLL